MKSKMPTIYVLIDLENVQPSNLKILANHPFKIIVFVGASQTKISFDIASAMQELCDDAKYIKISGNGHNALDFHIAFYIGELSCQEPDAEFHIISKDTGFDQLVNHLVGRGIRVQRETNLSEIPYLRISNATSADEKINAIIKNLVNRGQSRPRKVETLKNTINNLFTEKMDEAEVLSVVEKLKGKEFVIVSEGNVSYKLPNLP